MLERTDRELQAHMYDAIEKVVVYASKEIDIHWKFEMHFKAEKLSESEEDRDQPVE